MLFWAMMLILSLLLLALISDLQVSLVWSVSLCILLIGLAAYRLRLFQSKAAELIMKGSTLAVYDYETQRRNLILLLGLTFAAFLIPLLLASFLGASLWLGSIIGVTDGWIGQLFVYNIYLRMWEKRNHGTIYSLQVWEGSKVTHSGLSFEREGEKIE